MDNLFKIQRIKSKIIRIGLVLSFLSTLGSCESIFESGQTTVTIEGIDPRESFELAFAVFPETINPYFFVNKNDELFMALDEDINGALDGMYLQKGSDNILIKCDEITRLPTILTGSNGERLIFDFDEELTSVALTYFSNEDTEPFNEIVSINPEDYRFNEELTNKATGSKDFDYVGLQLAAKMLGFLASSVGCIISLATIPIGLTLSAAGALLTCAGAAVSLVSSVVAIANINGAEIGTEQINFVSNEFLVIDTLRCLSFDIGSCITSSLGLLDVVLEKRLEEINRVPEDSMGPYQWYKGTYVISVSGINEGLCSRGIGEKGDVFFYFDQNLKNYVVYYRSAFVDMPDIYGNGSSIGFMNNRNEVEISFGPAGGSPEMNIRIFGYRWKEGEYLRNDFWALSISSQGGSYTQGILPSICAGQYINAIPFDGLVNYVGELPPEELNEEEVERMKSLISAPGAVQFIKEN